MRRRELIVGVGGAAVLPIAARAQQARRIGVLMANAPTAQESQRYRATFEGVLRSVGWIDGRNLQIDYRWAAGDTQRSRIEAAALAAASPDLIVASSTSVLATVLQVTRTIPIIFIGVSDPVAQGFVASLPRPGGNITGFAAFEFAIGGKWLDLLKQLSPTLKRVALLGNPVTSPQFKFNLASVEAAGSTFGVEVIAAPIHDRAGIEATIAGLADELRGGLIIANDQFVRSQHLAEVVTLAARHRVPAIYAQRAFVEGGGLMCYSIVLDDAWRGAALYVNRILKGTKPSDLPVQLPVRYQLVINLKAAQALGLEIPLGLMLRADEVIE